MNFIYCFCCCFISKRKGVKSKKLAIKYWDDADEIIERPLTPDAKIKRKKRANLMSGITNLKYSTRKLDDHEDDDDDEDDDEEDDDVDEDENNEVEILLDEGTKKSSFSYYFCFNKKVIIPKEKTENNSKKKKKRKKKKKKKTKELEAENDNENNNENNNENENNNNEIENNEDINDEETKTENDNNNDNNNDDDNNSNNTKEPKVDAYKEKKRLRKLQKDAARLKMKEEAEAEEARLAALNNIVEVEDEYSKYHSVQHFPLGTSLLDIAAEEEKFKIETIKWRSYKRRQEKKQLKSNGWQDPVIVNSGCPKSFVPEGYIVEELAPPALDLKYINHRKVMFHWYDDELKPPVHGWFQGVICSAKKHGFNFCIKYDLEVTKNKHVNGVIGVNLSMSGENAYGLRWSIIKPINFIDNIYSEVLKFTENHEDNEEKDH